MTDAPIPVDRFVTRARLAADLEALGVPRGAAVMVHASLSRLGWVIGGATSAIGAIFDVLGPEGTVLAVTSWDDGPPYDQSGWSPQERAAWQEHCPPFDPRTCRAHREMGRVAEAIRTWPGARHSYHPDGAFAAIGAQAAWLVEGQRLDYGYSDDSPLDRLVRCGGFVLQLNAPLDTVTLYHLAEYRAAVPEARLRWNVHHMPVLIDGQRVWRTFRELDSSEGAFDYDALGLEVDAFEAITTDALAAGLGRVGPLGFGVGRLFAAPPLLEFATAWMTARFGEAG